MTEPQSKSRAELEQENTSLRELLKGVETRMEELAKTVAEMQASPDALEIVQLVQTYDPFESQNPHTIKDNPPGLRLSWKNAIYRERRGWRGWEPVTYDSEIGRALSKYLVDPPAKMEGMSHQDNYVRRGDAILCFIDEKIFEARQDHRVRQSSSAVNRVEKAASRTDTVQRGVRTTGSISDG